MWKLNTSRWSIPTERSAEGASENVRSFFLQNWSPPDDPARPCRPKASYGLVMMMMMIYPSSATAHLHVNGAWLYWNMIEIINNKFKECHHGATRPFITVWHWKIKMVILAAQANSLMIHLGRVPTTTKNLLGHLPDLSYLWKKFSRNKNVTL